MEGKKMEQPEQQEVTETVRTWPYLVEAALVVLFVLGMWRRAGAAS